MVFRLLQAATASDLQNLSHALASGTCTDVLIATGAPLAYGMFFPGKDIFCALHAHTTPQTRATHVRAHHTHAGTQAIPFSTHTRTHAMSVHFSTHIFRIFLLIILLTGVYLCRSETGGEPRCDLTRCRSAHQWPCCKRLERRKTPDDGVCERCKVI